MLSSQGSTPVVPYANITLGNGQQVTVLLENPKSRSLVHGKPQEVIHMMETIVLSVVTHSIDCV